MKTFLTRIGLAALGFCLATPSLTTAHLMVSAKYRIHESGEQWEDMIVDISGSSAITAATPDATTVEATLMDNPAMLRWELIFKPALSTSWSLNGNYDINRDSELEINLVTWPVGAPQEINSIKVMGRLDDINYDDTLSTLFMRVRPTDLTPSASLPSGDWGICVAYLSYAGNSPSDPGGQRDWGNTVIESNVSMVDVGMPMDPSSANLIGNAFSVNGLATTTADLKLHARYSVAKDAFGDREPLDAGVFIDGYQPSANFSWSIGPAPLTYSLTQAAETNPGDNDVITLAAQYQFDFSTRDFQFGYFNKPWLGSYQGSGGWLYLPWFGWVNPVAVPWAFHDELGWVYTPGSATYENLVVYLQSIGWVYTSRSLFPFLYVFDYQGSGFWAYYYRGTRAPNVFYRFDINDFLFVP